MFISVLNERVSTRTSAHDKRVITAYINIKHLGSGGWEGWTIINTHVIYKYIV